MNTPSPQPKPWFEIRNGLLIAGENHVCIDALSHYTRNNDTVTLNFIGGKNLVIFANPPGVQTGASELMAALDDAIAGPVKKGGAK